MATGAQIKAEVELMLDEQDDEPLRMSELQRELESRLGLEPGSMKEHKSVLLKIVTEGIVDHRGSTGLNQREYKSCFWDERHDAQRNRERVKALDRKFREKYPQIPGDIPAPLCGW
jgi:hypothetical protein